MDTHSTKRPSHRKQRSTSFSFFSSILGRRRTRSQSSLETIEVAPGILSTDATAIVFQLDPRRTKSQSPKKNRKKPDGPPPKPALKDLASKESRKSPEHPRLPSTLWGYIRAANKDDGTDDFTYHPNRIASKNYFDRKARRQDEARFNHQKAEEQRDSVRRRKTMRGSEDYLTVRFANPKTGLVSPSWPNTPNEEEESHDGGLGNGESRNAVEELRRKQGEAIRKGNEKWNARHQPLLSPIPQSSKGNSPSKNSHVSAPTDDYDGDQFILRMPSANEPQPFDHPGRTQEEIRAYQRGVEAARIQPLGGAGLLDPGTPPSPRPKSPDNRHTTRILSHRESKSGMIKRKPVGSPLRRKGGSEDTVIINGAMRASSLPVPNQNEDNPRIKITSPERVTRNLSSFSNHTSAGQGQFSQGRQHFLGQLADDGVYQTDGASRPPNENQHLHSPPSRQNTGKPQQQPIRPSQKPHQFLNHLPEANITCPDLVCVPTSQRPGVGNKGNLKPTHHQDAFTITTHTTGIRTIGLPRHHQKVMEVHDKDDGGYPRYPNNQKYQQTRDEYGRPLPTVLQRTASLSARHSKNNPESLVLGIENAGFQHPPCLVPGPKPAMEAVRRPSVLMSTSGFPNPGRKGGQAWEIEEELGNDKNKNVQSLRGQKEGGDFEGDEDYSGREVSEGQKGGASNYRSPSMEVGHSPSEEGWTGEWSESGNGNGSLGDDSLTEWRDVRKRYTRMFVSSEEVEEVKRTASFRTNTTVPVERKESNVSRKVSRGGKGGQDSNKKGDAKGKKDAREDTSNTSKSSSKKEWQWLHNLETKALSRYPRARTALHHLGAMLIHIQHVLTPWSSTNRLLTSPDAKLNDYIKVAKAWALAGAYVGVFAYAGALVVGFGQVAKGVGEWLGGPVLRVVRKKGGGGVAR